MIPAVAVLRARLASRRALAALAGVARGPRPIVAGPWASEVGFEILYWLPFLRWFEARFGVDPGDVVAVSRGGADPWYVDVAGSYVDLLDSLSPGELVTWRERRLASAGSEKQAHIGALDRGVLASVQQTLGAERVGWLHPALLYRLLHAAWISSDADLVVRHAVYGPLEAPAAPASLPPTYVALKAYFSGCFPDTPGNRHFLRGLVQQLAEREPVVLLRTATELDDHRGFVPGSGDRVIDAAPLLADPRGNLAVQTAIVAGARALATTYGGFSYLGSALGVPTAPFYSERNFNEVHLRVAGRAAASPLVPVHVSEYRLP